MTLRDDASPDTPPPETGHARVPVTHLWSHADRRREHGRSRKPECVVVGHAWASDPEREGWTLCLVCEVVRAP